MRGASKPFKVRLTHVPQDGLTPIWDDAAKKWGYVHKPSADLVSASASQLNLLHARSDNAFTKAEAAASSATAAQQSAATAQQTADSKATAEEAMISVYEKMLTIQRLGDSWFSLPAVLKLVEDEIVGRWVFRVDYKSRVYGQIQDFQAELDYVRNNEFYDEILEIKNRLEVIEQALGIQ